MNHKVLRLIFFLFCSLSLAYSCKNQSGNHRIVSVSILPQKYLIEKIAGDYLQVNVMIPPGMNPATCDLSTEQLRKLYDSDLCFTIGYLPFEQTHLYPVLSNRKDIPVINHSEGMNLLEGSCGHTHDETHTHGTDPHIWLSPRNFKTMATTVYRTLSERYPDRADLFRQNYDGLIQEIDGVDQKARQVFDSPCQKVFLIYHPALTYFAADYGLEQISIENEGKEPNPTHLKKIIDLARAKGIHLIFIQSQFDATNAEAIAREIGGRIEPIDPLAENWTGELLKWIGIFDAGQKPQTTFSDPDQKGNQ